MGDDVTRRQVVLLLALVATAVAAYLGLDGRGRTSMWVSILVSVAGSATGFAVITIARSFIFRERGSIDRPRGLVGGVGAVLGIGLAASVGAGALTTFLLGACPGVFAALVYWNPKFDEGSS
ncbi:MAG: hypothetical protein QOI61_2330 [Actinomycetota bacterium]|jgi:hypothetical protein